MLANSRDRTWKKIGIYFSENNNFINSKWPKCLAGEYKRMDNDNITKKN